jgi:large-conductance mechanosensitive channel
MPCLFEQNKVSKAISLAHTGIQYSDSIDDKKFVAFSAHTLYLCFKKINKPDSALYYLELNNQITDEVASTDINKELQQIEFTELLTQREENAQQVLENEKNRNKIVLYVFITAGIAFIIILTLQWRNNKQKQKANTLLQQQKEKVESTLSELKSTQAHSSNQKRWLRLENLQQVLHTRYKTH